MFVGDGGKGRTDGIPGTCVTVKLLDGEADSGAQSCSHCCGFEGEALGSGNF